ncbi:subclass B1 metallo-beta-lactamase [Maribacter algicola]|uniref:Subclass B1 metallo-beta-lactamase n=1 Tax=Meishania litoralis TaxID=3434685 RepID=A0ACC7LM88_9FLAO
MPFNKFILTCLMLTLVQLECKSQENNIAYSSDDLKILSISENSYVHVSYLDTSAYGKVECNGLIYLKNGEAIVFDTPIDNNVSIELLKWLMEDKKCQVKAVVVNHFHIDCLGGLAAFHGAKIPSYSNNLTITLAGNMGYVVPENGFDMQHELSIGGTKIINGFFGEAHTKDNIISYIVEEGLIFGGCAIKSLNAQKGNLADANLLEWSKTVQKIKENYPDTQIVVPGHGAHGDTALLDYTIELFKTD